MQIASIVKGIRRNERGANVVEFAIAAPVLLMLTVGATDFARIFIEAHAIVGAANSGVVFGARRNIDSVHYTEMETRALNDSGGAAGATAVGSQFCDCPQSPGTAVSCLDGVCAAYGKPRVYVKTVVSKEFSTLVNYPGIPYTTSIEAAGYMRVR